MALTEQTRRIVNLAWARMLGQLDDALETGDPAHRIEVINDDTAAVSFIQLFDRSILSGPEPVVASARELSAEQLRSERTLLQTTRMHHPGARILGAGHLLYCEEPPQLQPRTDVAVSFDPEHIAAVMADSPADDVTASGLVDASWAAALLQEGAGEQVLAAAGRQVWQKMLGHLGVLTAPGHRGRGYGEFIASVAVEEAFMDGLVPQWRAAGESPASRRAALRLGFTQAGTQTTVLLQ
ncbi:GNAT family N-acetyltransferase [Nesterenkonia sp.]|uniref:GNAT family N-acetyltransferase n=1 Tax=Nesterenkonia sp. TaxID=704201 RepID=UPI002634812B|nr:GNAT family N-acetyltransferase [Nesterenkonia sp.]